MSRCPARRTSPPHPGNVVTISASAGRDPVLDRRRPADVEEAGDALVLGEPDRGAEARVVGRPFGEPGRGEAERARGDDQVHADRAGRQHLLPFRDLDVRRGARDDRDDQRRAGEPPAAPPPSPCRRGPGRPRAGSSGRCGRRARGRRPRTRRTATARACRGRARARRRSRIVSSSSAVGPGPVMTAGGAERRRLSRAIVSFMALPFGVARSFTPSGRAVHRLRSASLGRHEAERVRRARPARREAMRESDEFLRGLDGAGAACGAGAVARADPPAADGQATLSLSAVLNGQTAPMTGGVRWRVFSAKDRGGRLACAGRRIEPAPSRP